MYVEYKMNEIPISFENSSSLIKFNRVECLVNPNSMLQMFRKNVQAFLAAYQINEYCLFFRLVLGAFYRNASRGSILHDDKNTVIEIYSLLYIFIQEK